MTPLIKNLFDSRTKSFFDSDISSLGVLTSIAESLKKFDLFITLKHGVTATYPNWKSIARKILKSQPGVATVTPILKCKLLALVLQM